MESPRCYLERRSDEVDRELSRSLEHLCQHPAAADFVQQHPFAALGAGAATGFLAARLLRGRHGLKLARHLFAVAGKFAVMAATFGARGVTPTGSQATGGVDAAADASADAAADTGVS